MFRLSSLLILALALAFASPGCLEATSGRTGATDATPPTSDTDTQLADATRCTPGSCDDGDPCTDQYCNTATGECVYSVYAAQAPECQGVGDCDDDDPCTLDECVFVSDDNACVGGFWSYCKHTASPQACGGCQNSGCDDADPCTLDTCLDDGTCLHSATPNCESRCSSANAVAVDAIFAGAYALGQSVTAAGRADAIEDPTCTPANGCDCQRELGLFGQDAALFLEPGDASLSPFQCREDSCTNETTVCAPLWRDARYWVWGTLDGRYPYGAQLPAEDPGRPAPPANTLRVEGFCLQTNEVGLPGLYSATWDTLDGSVVHADVEIRVGLDAMTMTITPRSCADCPEWLYLPAPQTVPIDVYEGYLEIDHEAPGACGAPAAAGARLFSQGNQLVGPYYDPWQSPYSSRGGMKRVDVASCAWGDLTLTRLP